LDAAKAMRAKPLAGVLRESSQNLPKPATRNNTVLIRPFAENLMTQFAWKVRLHGIAIALLLVLSGAAGAQSERSKPNADEIIWQDPGNIRSLNLF
jgi:hypothetical protein